MTDAHEVLSQEEVTDEQAADALDVGDDEPVEAPDPEEDLSIELAEPDELEAMKRDEQGEEAG